MNKIIMIHKGQLIKIVHRSEGGSQVLISQHVGTFYADLQFTTLHNRIIINSKSGLDTFIVNAYENEDINMYMYPPKKH